MSGKRNPPFRKMKSTRDPTYDDILAIARLIEAGSRFTEFRLRSGDIEVEVKRAPATATIAAARAAAASAELAAATAPAEPGAAPGATSPASAPHDPPQHLPPGARAVTAPMAGTFYRASQPGAAPFVEVGTRVAPETIVGIVEVMKLMSSIPAGVAGVVTQVLAPDAQPVQAGQALLVVGAE